MADIRVWAPKASLVELENGGKRVSMIRDQNGWWRLDAPFIEHGSDYAFHLDGEGPFPDPRSPWQPEGVEGPSRWLDHQLFDWSDSGWRQRPLSSAVIYELHVGTFTPEGTFEAVIDHLDDLIELGITHLELMPVAEFSGDRGWGYDAVDLYAPHHAYGGPEGLKRLVDACHQRDLAVLLDVVYNHLGPVGNYLGRFAPYFTDRHATPWGEAVNLDGADSHQVRRFFIDNALMWLRDYHLDGLRLDAVHAIIDTSAVHFLEQLKREVESLESAIGRHLYLIAASDRNDPRVFQPRQLGGYGLDAQWNEDFHHALQALLTGEQNGYYQDFGRLADLARALRQGFVYDGCFSPFRRRLHGKPIIGADGRRLIGYLQNHDQIGNRARGDRVTRLLTLGQLKIGAALVFMSPFIPLLFQGEEWGATTPFLYFTDHRDPVLGEAVRQERQAEFAAFGWDPQSVPDPQALESFLQSKLDRSEIDQVAHSDLLQWYTALIKWRKLLPAVMDGRLNETVVRFDEDAGWLILIRGAVWTICNFADTDQDIECPALDTRTLVLSSDERITTGKDVVSMPFQSVGIWAR